MRWSEVLTLMSTWWELNRSEYPFWRVGGSTGVEFSRVSGVRRAGRFPRSWIDKSYDSESELWIILVGGTQMAKIV